jgi:hypothetical protein
MKTDVGEDRNVHKIVHKIVQVIGVDRSLRPPPASETELSYNQ